MRFILLMFLALSTILAYGLPSDKYQPLKITSDHFILHYKNGVAIYSGNVVGDQGTRHLVGDKLIITRDNKTKKIKDINVYGTPAKFNYLPKKDGKQVYAQALHVHYDPATHLLTLKKDAKIEQDGNVSSGPYITYDTQAKVATSASTHAGRSMMIIQPYEKIQKSDQQQSKTKKNANK